MSSADEPSIEVPPDLFGGVWSNYVNVYGDVEEITFDFVRLDPKDPREGVVVARVTASRWCILRLRQLLEDLD